MTSPNRADYPVPPTNALHRLNAATREPQARRFRLPQWGPWSWAIALGALLAIGLPVMALRTLVRPQSYNPQQSEKAVPAQTQVAALGRLEPEGGSIDVGIPLGSIVKTLLVAEGDTVEKDQVLAYLNGYAEQLANRDLMASQLEEAKQQLQTSLSADQAQINAAAVRLEGVGLPQSNAVIAQQAIVRQRAVDYDQAQVELARFEQLFQEGAISRQTYEQQRTETNQLAEEYNQAEATLAQLVSTRQTDLESAAAELEVSEANLERTHGQNKLVSVAQQLALAEAQLEQTIIRAPKAGQVLRILTHSGESATDNGIGGGTLLQLGNTRQMYVVAEVYESDASLVKTNQSATIVSRNQAFEGELSGTVASIGRQIFKNNLLNDDPAALDDARVVEVKIRLDDSTVVADLTNLQVDVRIDVESDPREKSARGSTADSAEDSEESNNPFPDETFIETDIKSEDIQSENIQSEESL